MRTSVKLFGVVAGMAVLFASCNKQEEILDPVNKTIEMTIVAGSDDTKTVLGGDGVVTWSNSGEKLAVIEAAVTNSVTTTAKETSNDGDASNEGTTMTFGVSMSPKIADSFSYYALYPNSAYVDKPDDLTNVKVNLASTQAPTESSFGPSADVLVAKPIIGLNAQPKKLNLQFARVIAIGKMTIKDLNTDENVKKVTFTAAGKAVTGSSYIDFTTADGVEYGYSGQGVDKVVLDYSNKNITANGMTAVFTCWPFSLDAGETFSVEVETKSCTFKKNITLAEGKSLAFNVGRASAFNVSFSGIDGVALADGVYVVAQDNNIMTVGTTSQQYRGVATLPTKNGDGSYSVEATAAWNFVYNSATGTYKINSASDNALYLQGSSTKTNLNLVAQDEATSFTITKKDDGTFKIDITSDGKTRYIGYNYNSGSSRFAMYATSSNLPIDLNLYPAKVVILPKIEVQETLPVPNAETIASFPVTLTNVKETNVKVYKDAACTTLEEGWITAGLNAESNAIDYYVLANTGKERTAYIKIDVSSSDGSEATAIVKVTQAAAGASAKVEKTATITFGTNNVKIDDASVTANDNCNNSWTITTVGTTSFTANADYYQVGSSKKPATSITFTTTLPSDAEVSSIEAKFGGFSGTAGTVSLKVGDTSVGSGSLNADNDVTVSSNTTAAGIIVTVSITGIAKGVKCYHIKVGYKTAN